MILHLAAFLLATTPPPPLVELRLADGGSVRAELLAEHVDVLTRYGPLKVPVADITRIEFGRHYPPGLRAKLVHAAGELGSVVHAEREAAAAELQRHGHFAVPLLRIAAKSTDPEVQRRAAALLKRIEESESPALLALRDDDLLETAAGPIAGRIQLRTLQCRSAILGTLKLGLPNLRALRMCAMATSIDVAIDAGKFGGETDWLDTGVRIDQGLRLTVAAGGQVDLWIQTPGMYVAEPAGHQNVIGKLASFKAGALIGRIGERGQPFLVGAALSAAGDGEGRLYLRIVPSAWNTPAVGSYTARIRTEPR